MDNLDVDETGCLHKRLMSFKASLIKLQQVFSSMVSVEVVNKLLNNDAWTIFNVEVVDLTGLNVSARFDNSKSLPVVGGPMGLFQASDNESTRWSTL
jgi:hypothetical protein